VATLLLRPLNRSLGGGCVVLEGRRAYCARDHGRRASCRHDDRRRHGALRRPQAHCPAHAEHAGVAVPGNCGPRSPAASYGTQSTW